jgi:hypothetical protein
MQKISYIFILLFFIIGCKPKQSTTANTESSPKEEQELTVDEPREITSLLPIQISETNDMKSIGDTYQIKKAVIQDQILWLTLTYGGGCEEHEFQLLFDNAYSESGEESNSKKIRLTLHHNGNDDRCRSIVSQSIRFDLKQLQTPDTQKLDIVLSGWEALLEYQY